MNVIAKMFGSKLDRLQLFTLRAELKDTGGNYGSILWITFSRSQAFNAISMEMLEELHIILDMLSHPISMHEPLPPDHPRVLVISSDGNAFSAGVDVKAADRGVGGIAWDYKDMRSQQLLARLIQKLRSIPQPVISLIKGPAVGGGLAIALASDCRIATESASFQAAFVRLGLTGTDMGTSFFLPRIAGLGIASEMLLTGRSISAERAHQVGLVNELVQTNEDLVVKGERLAKEMLQCSLKGLQLTKEQLSATAEGGSLSAAMTAENSHQMLLINDPAAIKAAQQWLDSLMLQKPQRSKL